MVASGYWAVYIGPGWDVGPVKGVTRASSSFAFLGVLLLAQVPRGTYVRAGTELSPDLILLLMEEHCQTVGQGIW